MPAWHTVAPEDAARRLESDLEDGLAAEVAARRLAEDGPNEVKEETARPWWHLLLAQFRSLIVLLLLVATLVAFALGDHLEAIAILVVILLNVTIGFVTERGAARALEALREHAAHLARVVRGGAITEVPARELVRGDLVVLEAGTIIPADGRIVTAERLQVDESVLTGESSTVHKTTDTLDDEELAVGDRVNLAHSGTAVVDGRGAMVVTATGMETEIGRIGTLVEEADAPTATPLDRELDRLGRILVVAVLALSAVILLLGWLRGTSEFWPMLELAVSLAIAAVPEGLPAVATMTLALGMRRMAERRALIRRLPAVETLGSTTVICTDKTGTLTRNEMTATALVVAGEEVAVSGTGYTSDGEIEGGAQAEHAVQQALRIAALCNDAEVDVSGDEPRVVGDPTEAALLVLARKGGIDTTALRVSHPREQEVPFSAEARRMTTVHRTPEGTLVAMVKGSPGTLLELCTAMDDETRSQWLEANLSLAGRALRVLALAWRELPGEWSEEDLSRELTFAGLVGMLDPLRDEARPAIDRCRAAGIRVLMLTGDQLETAREIGRQLGIDRDADGNTLRAMHARDLREGEAADDVSVFARISPEHKLRIVAALQERGDVVAMTGDGVNDAPALRQADIGVAMGIKGTDVARAASDMVLTDDNFASIAAAVGEGRVVHANITRFIQYLFSCNLSELIVVTAAILAGWPLPLAALQILWLNLITDVLPAMALALEPAEPHLMRRPPRDPDAALLDRPLITRIAWQGALLAAATLAAFATGLGWHGDDGDALARAVTMAFSTLALAQVLHVFGARSATASLFTGLFRNRWIWAATLACVAFQVLAVSLPLLQRVLGTVLPTGRELLVIVACAAVPQVVIEVVKRIAATGDR